MQKNGAGLDTGTALFWDNAKDGLVCTPPAWPRFFSSAAAAARAARRRRRPRPRPRCVGIPWENSEMHVVITIFGTALNVDNLAELD